MEHRVLHMSVHCRAGMHESTRKSTRFRRQLCSCSTDASDSDDDDDQDVNGSNQLQSVCPVSAPPSQVMREVCLIEQGDARLAFVPCGHQRFCASCVAHLEQQARGCPMDLPVRDYHGSASLQV